MRKSCQHHSHQYWNRNRHNNNNVISSKNLPRLWLKNRLKDLLCQGLCTHRCSTSHQTQPNTTHLVVASMRRCSMRRITTPPTNKTWLIKYNKSRLRKLDQKFQIWKVLATSRHRQKRPLCPSLRTNVRKKRNKSKTEATSPSSSLRAREYSQQKVA